MPFNITIDHATTAPSVISEEGSDGVEVSPQSASDREGYSLSDPSDHQEDYVQVHLPFPSELPDQEQIQPSDSASRSGSDRRQTAGPSRSDPSRRPHPRRHTGQGRDPVAHKLRDPVPASPESVDSAEEYAAGPYRALPQQRQSFYGGGHVVPQPMGYAQSSSSGASYGYPAVSGPGPGPGPGPPPGPGPGPGLTHMVHYGHPQPAPAPYNQHYPHMAPPTAQGYHTPTHGYQPPMSHHSSHVSSPYASPPYAAPSMMPFAPPLGYFPPQFQPPFQQFMDPYQRYSSPRHNTPPPAPAAPAAAPAPAGPDQEEIVRRVEALFQREKDERQVVADQEEIVKRVEKLFLAEKEERLKREEQREAEARAAAAAAIAKAERAASDAKIAEEAASKAAAAAKEKAEKEAAASAAKAKEESEAKLKEAEAKSKEAEAKSMEAEAKSKELEAKKKEAEAKSAEAEAEAAKAKKEAEDAVKATAAALAPPPAKKAPIRFKDAVGRKFNFPFHLCAKWTGMEELIRQAFLHVEVIGPHVQDGHYDLLGPNGEIILPQVWETVIEPDWIVTMHMWPMPEPKPEPKLEDLPIIPPPLGDGILNMEDIFGGGKKPKHKEKGPGGRFSFLRPPKPGPPPPLDDLMVMFPDLPLPPPPPPVAAPAPRVPPPPAAAAAAPLLPPPPPPPPAAAAAEHVIDKPRMKPVPSKSASKKASRPGGIGMWMMGNPPPKPATKPAAKPLKVVKKPDSVAGSQHTANSQNGTCGIM